MQPAVTQAAVTQPARHLSRPNRCVDSYTGFILMHGACVSDRSNNSDRDGYPDSAAAAETPRHPWQALSKPPCARRRLLSDFLLLGLVMILLVAPTIRWSRARSGVQVAEWPLERLKIDINTAPWYEWALLEGIGERRARRVVEFRASHGPFVSFDELKAIPGMPSGWVERVSANLSLR